MLTLPNPRRPAKFSLSLSEVSLGYFQISLDVFHLPTPSFVYMCVWYMHVNLCELTSACAYGGQS